MKISHIVKQDYKPKLIAKHWGGFNGRKIPDELVPFIKKHIKTTSNGYQYIPEYNDSWYGFTFNGKYDIVNFKTFIKIFTPYFSIHRVTHS